jgi:hypothetical protein
MIALKKYYALETWVKQIQMAPITTYSALRLIKILKLQITKHDVFH